MSFNVSPFWIVLKGERNGACVVETESERHWETRCHRVIEKKERWELAPRGASACPECCGAIGNDVGRVLYGNYVPQTWEKEQYDWSAAALEALGWRKGLPLPHTWRVQRVSERAKETAR
jgi:hypothetical protein